MPSPHSVWRLAGSVSLLVASLLPSAGLAQTDPTMLWLAAGARNAPCEEPTQCAMSLGLACVGEVCVPAGTANQSCRPMEHPLGRECDPGLACDEGVCMPAGGAGQICNTCTSIVSACDRCDWGLGCDLASFTCESGGALNQPCRDTKVSFVTGLRQTSCDDGLACVMGQCVATGGEGQPCGTGDTCETGYFCEQIGSGYDRCTIQPRGLVARADSAVATQCVENVPAAFARLARQSNFTNVFSFDANENQPLPPFETRVPAFDTDVDINSASGDRDHVQGILKLPGNPYRMLITRSANDRGEAAGLMIADRSMSRFYYPMDRSPIVSHHPGGFAMFGHSIAVAVEHGTRYTTVCEPYLGSALEVCEERRDTNSGWIDFWQYDPSNAGNPLRHVKQWNTNFLSGNGRRPSSVAMTQLPDGKPFIFMLGGASLEGWLLTENRFGSMRQLFHFPDMMDREDWLYWSMFQSAQFVTDCTGALFLVMSSGDVGARGENDVRLFELTAQSRGDYALTFRAGWEAPYDGDRCQGRYGASAIVENGELSYLCSAGLSTLRDGRNIGVAEIHAR